MPEYADRFLLSIHGLSQEMRVVRFAGTEGLGELFHLEVTFASEDPAIDPDDALGKPAVLTMLLGDGTDRYVSGIVSRFEQGDAGKKLTAYHVTVVPKVWRLLHRHDIRIFQELSAPDIIKKVLAGAGLASGDDFRVSLQGTYKSREYCVQYRESDWAFVCRLMEEEGIAWFFEHKESGHVLVLCDRPAAFAPIAGKESVPFRPALGALVEDEHVASFRYAGEVRPGKVSLRDFDFVKPTLLPEGAASASGPNADTDLEIYDYPGIYEITADGFADGAALSKIRLEERRSHRVAGEGESACARLVPGYTFTLAEHPREALNQRYLVTRLAYQGVEPAMGEHGGEAPEGRYGNRFVCIPATVPFHPPVVTPRPFVRGVQTAIVVGPAGEEIYTDKHGRVKVQFHWDRLGKKDDKSSCWIRVSQVWAGEAWGAMHIPRVGQEVVVDFLEGDPDRPLVVGRVYHGTNVVPYGLPDNRTRSTIKSSSSPGGGGSNELRFEDKKGNEEVYLHAQKDLTIAVENDKNQTVGHDETLHVSHDRTATVDHDETQNVGNDRTRSVGHDEKVDISNNRTVTVGADHTETISGNHSLTIDKTSTVAVTKDTSVSLDAKLALAVTAKATLDLKADLATTVGGTSSEDVKLDKNIKAGSTVVIECGDSKITIDKSGNVKVEGKDLKVSIDGPAQVTAQKLEVSSSGEVKVAATGKVEVKGSGPMNIEASGMVKLKGSQVGIN
jgi:type VI secretion system secreted protein VgrG